MAISLRFLVLFFAVLQLSLAIPTTEGTSSRVDAFDDNKPVPVSRSASSSPFRKLRDVLIEKIWTIPQKKQPGSANLQTSVPQKFRTKYGNDVVLRFQIGVQEQLNALLKAAEILYLDIWETTEEWIDIRVAKDMVPSLVGLLPPTLHVTYIPLGNDLVQKVYNTYPASFSKNSDSWRNPMSDEWSGQPHDVFFQEYQPLSVLYPWLRFLAAMFSDHVTLSSIGISAEGRDIAALRIGARPKESTNDDHPNRPTLLIVGGSHAREWISVSTTAYIAYSLVTRYGDPNFSHVNKLLDNFDLVFIPTLNPDGYDYTWSTDRLWRKTRQATSIPFCPGIDLDRAFAFAWDGNDTTDNACSEEYAGFGPLSAVESRHLAEWAKNETENNNVTFVAFLDLHSYSQRILYPYSFSCKFEPPNLEDLEEVAMGLAKSFRVTNGHYYSVSSACEGSISMQEKDQKSKSRSTIKVQSQGGSALDFFYHELGVKYSYQIKLRDTGTYGFLLPKSNIIPAGYEAFEAVLGLGKWLLGNHGIEKYDDDSAIWGKDEKEESTISKEQSSPPSKDDNVETYDDDEESELRRRRRRR